MGEIKGVYLIIDTNYILYRTVFTLSKLNTIYGDLERSLEVIFKGYLSKYPFKKIYMVSDAKNPWRKRFYKDYKATREKSGDIDWEFVFNTYDKFKIDFCAKNKRVELIEGENIEGDDWIRAIVNKSNKNGYSTIFVSSDKDLNQLLEFRNTGWINIQWNDSYKNGKLFLPENHNIFVKEVLEKNVDDIFSMNENFDFLKLLNDLKSKFSCEEIDK